MSPERITEIANGHLEKWFDDASNQDETITLRARVADAIEEALAEQAKLTADGIETMRFERDKARADLYAINCRNGTGPSDLNNPPFTHHCGPQHDQE